MVLRLIASVFNSTWGGPAFTTDVFSSMPKTYRGEDEILTLFLIVVDIYGKNL